MMPFIGLMILVGTGSKVLNKRIIQKLAYLKSCNNIEKIKVS